MFTLDQLRGFVTVADELHFGRAAQRLQMTQPPLSRQVQKLERAVGAQLLERDTRKVSLTPAGVAFLAEARRLLGWADGASEQARRIQDGSSGTVRVGFTATSTFGVLTRLLDLVGASYPDIHLDLREMVSREQVAALLAGELDVGLARPPFDPTIFASRLLHREALLVAAPTDHRLAGLQRELSADDLAGDLMIAYSPIEARYFYDLVARLVPVDPKSVAYSVSQIVTMLWLVAGGRGLAIVPASASKLRIDGVAFLPLAGITAQPVELHLVWPRDTRNAAVRSIATSIDPAVFAPPSDR